MKTILNFWHKDLINKLIALVILALFISFVFVFYIVLTLPKDSIIYTSLFPASKDRIPTLEVIPTETRIPTSTNAIWPTATPRPSTPTISAWFSPTPFPSTPTATSEPPTPLPNAATPTLSSALAANCIPHSEPLSGKVLDIVDGNTIKVLISDEVYTVRYLGIQVPKNGDTNELFAPEASFKNGNLVFTKEVKLFRDTSDKDTLGRMLQYVMVEETFVNLELVRLGLATADDVVPDSACAQVFKDAEQAARQAQVGMWKSASAPIP